MEIPTLARGINRLFYSVLQLLKSHEKYRPKRIQDFFFHFIFFLCCIYVRVCVCVLEFIRNWNVKN